MAIIRGNGRANTLNGTVQADVISGGLGNDRLAGGPGKDQLAGGFTTYTAGQAVLSVEDDVQVTVQSAMS